jgi:methanethiol S-methyltransferase
MEWFLFRTGEGVKPMIAWLNFTVLLFSSLAFLAFYVRSVSPAFLEKINPGKGYQSCFTLRAIAILFEMITLVCFVLYYFYPLQLPIPAEFPWSWWISVVIALGIGIPAVTLMIIGMKDAGEEMARPKPEHTMYTGIYEKIRHPQAVGEVFLWLVTALLLNSPFLAIYSLVFFPIFIIFCWVEEQDLLLRFGEPYAEYLQATGAYWPKRSN